MRLILACLALLVLGGYAHAATVFATPSTVKATFAAAQAGDTVMLAPGEYGIITVPKGAASLSIDAGQASIARLRIDGVTGLNWKDGVFDPRKLDHWTPTIYVTGGSGVHIDGVTISDGWTNHGASFRDTTDFTFTNARLDKLKVAVICQNSTDFVIRGVGITDKGWDGVDIKSCRKGVVEYVTCLGTKLIGANHPDCVQLDSADTTKPPTSDITIRYNFAYGQTQGFNGFTSTGLGYDRILIEENRAYIAGQSNAITLIKARDSVVRNNHVRTLDTQRDAARVTVTGERNTVCGNVALFNALKPPAIDPDCQ